MSNKRFQSCFNQWLLCAGMLALPAYSADHPGKTVFAETCAQCHGPTGAGKTYGEGSKQVTVPSLRSEYVQSKPDSELRAIITGGRREMPPVQMGKPTMKHGLSTKQVNSVIGFVRTLED